MIGPGSGGGAMGKAELAAADSTAVGTRPNIGRASIYRRFEPSFVESGGILYDVARNSRQVRCPS